MIVQIYVKTLPVNFNGARMLWAKCLKRTDSSVRGGECGASWNGQVVGAVHYYDPRHGCFPHDLACDGIQVGSDLRYADECVRCIVALHGSCNFHCLCASYEARRRTHGAADFIKLQ